MSDMLSRLVPPRLRVQSALLSSAALICSAVLVPTAALADEDGGGAVYTMTNAVSGNQIVAFGRSGDGSLSPEGTYTTGRNGTGTGLGSGHSLVTTDNGRYVIAVNAGH